MTFVAVLVLALAAGTTGCCSDTKTEARQPGSGGFGAEAYGGSSGNDTGDSSGTGNALGAFPVDLSPVSRGGTITFTNVGAPGWWPRRLNREQGDPACDYKDGTDTWGGHCCLAEHATASSSLSPFDEEMALILEAVNVRQRAVDQPQGPGAQDDWRRVSWWDARDGLAHNLWFTQNGNGSTSFPGDLTRDDCNGYVMHEPAWECGDGRDHYCQNDPGIEHLGWSGSKLVVFLASMTFEDADVHPCGGSGAGHPGPWVAFDASALYRDGASKWDGQCNCYSKTGTVGEGCGEINVFEVVLDDNQYSNREFTSTGVRSYQAGHVGGSVCGAACDTSEFPSDAAVVDACSHQAYGTGPVVEVGGKADGCPVWRRPWGYRYFTLLLDQSVRAIQVAFIHPQRIPEAARALLPDLPGALHRKAIDDLMNLRLPEE